MKKCKICFMLAVSLLLMGCQDMVALDDSQKDEVAEYMGGLLLEHSSTYEGMLLPEEIKSVQDEEETVQENCVDVSPTPASIETTDKTESITSKVKDTNEQSSKVTVADVMGFSGCEIQINETLECDSFPENNDGTGFVLNASEGKKLFVLKLQIKNNSSSNKVIDTRNFLFECIADDGKVKEEALVSLLKDDIHFLNCTVKTGKSIKGILVFQIQKDMDTKNIQVYLSSKQGKANLEF